MTANEINRSISKDEAIGRARFSDFQITQQPDWDINKFSETTSASWDVSYYTGTTRDMVIGEIKNRSKSDNQYDTWILEEIKIRGLFETKRLLQLKYPNASIYIHYINFYNNTDKPRFWDITNLIPDFESNSYPKNSFDPNAKIIDKLSMMLKNNEAINL
ncbi:hypothetical protein ACFFLS_06165 [Flavobacterium procerum]|uniref:DUF3883 domain-containing protein n=1 Tax=Flavobacterium procerum TaxID=1455569 RepID=A0ABV6BME6_9FLAO